MSYTLENVLITGRTYEEYMAFFDLDEKSLVGKKVLDCPSGASSFIKTAKQKGIVARGADILYRFDIEEIKKQGIKTIDEIYKDTSWMDGYSFEFYKSRSNHRTYRERALEGFYEDFNSFDYTFCELPKLSYEDDTFDLLLSSHFLFTYDDRFSYEFYKSSIVEMLRISREIRIFPLVGYQNKNVEQEKNFSPYVYKIIEELGGEIVKVDFEFQKNAAYMLKIKK